MILTFAGGSIPFFCVELDSPELHSCCRKISDHLAGWRTTLRPTIPDMQELSNNGIIISVVKCCIRSRDEPRQGEAHIVWRNIEAWTREHSKA